MIGTRPEAIKMAPVILALLSHPHKFKLTVISTGQHKTMLESAMSAFGLKPDVDLDVMRPGQSLAQLTSSLLLELERQFILIQPDLVLVHGDTTSAMVGAMAAFYLQIEVAHIEAGLRTSNLLSPFPEEYNRRCVAIAARYHFAPTTTARENLEREGVSTEQIIVTGNTVIDALLLATTKLENLPHEVKQLNVRLATNLGFDIATKSFVLITAHRRENLGAGIDNICYSIRELAKANPSLYFVYPVHLNPKVKNAVEGKLGGVDNIVLIPPQAYLEFAWLLRNCLLVLTDSGGIQEEAPAFGKPVLVMRDTSERPEAIIAGTALLVSTDPKTVIREAQKLISDPVSYGLMARAINPFGDGKAADRIVSFLLSTVSS